MKIFVANFLKCMLRLQFSGVIWGKVPLVAYLLGPDAASLCNSDYLTTLILI